MRVTPHSQPTTVEKEKLCGVSRTTSPNRSSRRDTTTERTALSGGDLRPHDKEAEGWSGAAAKPGSATRKAVRASPAAKQDSKKIDNRAAAVVSNNDGVEIRVVILYRMGICNRVRINRKVSMIDCEIVVHKL